MTVQPPSGDGPQPVPGLPGWFWWLGADGLLHARREVAAHNFTVLLARIRRAEGDTDG